MSRQTTQSTSGDSKQTRPTAAVVYLQIRAWKHYDASSCGRDAINQQRKAANALAVDNGLTITDEYVDDICHPEDRTAHDRLVADLRANMKRRVIVARIDDPSEPPEIIGAGQFLMIDATGQFCAAFATDDDAENVIECPDPMLHSGLRAGKAGT